MLTTAAFVLLGVVLCFLFAPLVFADSQRAEDVGQVVDLIELNAIQRGGEKRFEQLIFWEWSPEYSRYHVKSWVAIDQNHRLAMLPEKHGGRYRVMVPGIGLVTSANYRETVTEHDPERENLKIFPEFLRVPLVPLRKHRPPCW